MWDLATIKKMNGEDKPARPARPVFKTDCEIIADKAAELRYPTEREARAAELAALLIERFPDTVHSVTSPSFRIHVEVLP